MKLFGLRIRTWIFFGIGFLLGSRMGTGPWEQVMEMVNDLRGRAGGDDSGNGQVSGLMSSSAPVGGMAH
jgi:hypothetical protein